MRRVALLLALMLGTAASIAVAAPQIAVTQVPASDVTVGDPRLGDGLALTVFAASYLRSDSATSVLVGVEIHGLAGTVPQEDGMPRQLEITCLIDTGASTAAEPTVAVPLANAEVVSTAVRQGARVFTRMTLPAGRYTLRVLARDSGDRRTASVAHTLEVPDLLEASMTMSGLTLSSSDVGGVTHAPTDVEDRILPLVAQPPTGRRQFSRGEHVEVDAEIYQAGASVPFDESDDQLSVTTSILAPDGRVLYETSDAGASETLPSGVYGYHHYALLPIATLAPGPYAVRITAWDGATSISRSVPIIVLN